MEYQSFVASPLDPAFTAEERQECHSDNDHCPKDSKISIFRAKFRHVFEIHTLYHRHKSERHEDDRQDWRYPIQSVSRQSNVAISERLKVSS
ncbi:MAG: hypothetical protein ACI9CE_002507 [Flavobacterium sp.]|jgi:hypothetical protein